MYIEFNKKWIEITAKDAIEAYIKLCIGDYKELNYEGVCVEC